ncbi:inositol phospholipid synthesis and fat-storage-inducing TM-domain-containing protein, partial [Xylariaceae sp. FL0255]
AQRHSFVFLAGARRYWNETFDSSECCYWKTSPPSRVFQIFWTRTYLLHLGARHCSCSFCAKHHPPSIPKKKNLVALHTVVRKLINLRISNNTTTPNFFPDGSQQQHPASPRSHIAGVTKMPSRTKHTGGAPNTTRFVGSQPMRRVQRTSPFLPTPLESLCLALYPVVLIFGTLFSVLSPETRAAPFDALRHSHVQALAPNYFARKDNLFNVLFVKRGWAWITVAFLAFVGLHPAFRASRSTTKENGNGNGNGSGSSYSRAVKAMTRWAIITSYWIAVTQWFFGPPLIDRGFKFTGGKCAVATRAIHEGDADKGEIFTAVACRAAGGDWSGGHDISGHVFLLVLGSCFLAQEVIWVVRRAGGFGVDDRSVVMDDGAVKGAGVEAVRGSHVEGNLGHGGRFAVGVVALSVWMLLMTAIYFHTWFEKLTGLLVASAGLYAVYILPRWIPALRAIVGMPGI